MIDITSASVSTPLSAYQIEILVFEPGVQIQLHVLVMCSRCLIFAELALPILPHRPVCALRHFHFDATTSCDRNCQPAIRSKVVTCRALSGLLLVSQIKKARKKYKPDICLWVDRLDVLRRPGSDFPVLQQVSDALDSSVWFNTVRFHLMDKMN